MDIGFAMNYANLYEINVTPEAAAPTWERVAAGINSVEWEGNEEVAQDSYYDGDGLSSSEVTGGQIVGTFEGHRIHGNPAQDFIASRLVAYGADRKTDFKWIAPDGQTLEGIVTIANINPQGGDPNAKSDFGFEVHFNGMPSFTEGDSDTFPEAIQATAVTVKVGGTASVNPTITPEKASPAVAYAIEDTNIATVDANGTVKGVKAGKTKVTIKSCVRPIIAIQADVTVSGS